MNPETVVILDAGNYIKGYRYELHCAAKSTKSTQITLHCDISPENGLKFNELREEKYSNDTYNALVMRYEEPNGRNRWDSPLFTIHPEDTVPYEAINDALFNKKLPTPNLSTQNAPLSSTNFLYELDRQTQEIDQVVLGAVRMGLDCIKLPGDIMMDCEGISAPQLTKLRRQFIAYTKMHPADVSTIPNLYVQFLKSSLCL